MNMEKMIVDSIIRSFAGGLLLDTAHQVDNQVDISCVHDTHVIERWIKHVTPVKETHDSKRVEQQQSDVQLVISRINVRARELALDPSIHALRDAVKRCVAVEVKREQQQQQQDVSVPSVKYEILPLHDVEDDGEPLSIAERAVKSFWKMHDDEYDAGIVDTVKCVMKNETLIRNVMALTNQTRDLVLERVGKHKVITEINGVKYKDTPLVPDNVRMLMNLVYREYDRERFHLNGHVVRFHVGGQTVGIVCLFHEHGKTRAGHEIVLMQGICCSYAFYVAKRLFPELRLGSLNDAALQAATNFARQVNATRVYVQPIGHQLILLRKHGLATEPNHRFEEVVVSGMHIPPQGFYFGKLLFFNPTVYPSVALIERLRFAVTRIIAESQLTTPLFDWTCFDVATLLHHDHHHAGVHTVHIAS